MKKRDKFDTLVLFEKGIYLPIDDTYFYGFFLNKQKKIKDYHDINLTLDEGIKKYISYLVGVQEWTGNGNSITEDKEYFVKDNKFYSISGDFVTNYCKQLYETKPIGYTVIYNCHVDDTSGIDNDTIVSEETFNQMKEKYGQGDY